MEIYSLHKADIFLKGLPESARPVALLEHAARRAALELAHSPVRHFNSAILQRTF